MSSPSPSSLPLFSFDSAANTTDRNRGSVAHGGGMPAVLEGFALDDVGGFEIWRDDSNPDSEYGAEAFHPEICEGFEEVFASSEAASSTIGERVWLGWSDAHNVIDEKGEVGRFEDHPDSSLPLPDPLMLPHYIPSFSHPSWTCWQDCHTPPELSIEQKQVIIREAIISRQLGFFWFPSSPPPLSGDASLSPFPPSPEFVP